MVAQQTQLLSVICVSQLEIQYYQHLALRLCLVFRYVWLDDTNLTFRSFLWRVQYSYFSSNILVHSYFFYFQQSFKSLSSFYLNLYLTLIIDLCETLSNLWEFLSFLLSLGFYFSLDFYFSLGFYTTMLFSILCVVQAGAVQKLIFFLAASTFIFSFYAFISQLMVFLAKENNFQFGTLSILMLMTLVIDLNFLLSPSFSLIIYRGSVSIFCLRQTIFIFLIKGFSQLISVFCYLGSVLYLSACFMLSTSIFLSEISVILFSLCTLLYFYCFTSTLVAVLYKFQLTELIVLHFLFLQYLSKDQSILFLLSFNKQFSSCDWFIIESYFLCLFLISLTQLQNFWFTKDGLSTECREMRFIFYLAERRVSFIWSWSSPTVRYLKQSFIDRVVQQYNYIKNLNCQFELVVHLSFYLIDDRLRKCFY